MGHESYTADNDTACLKADTVIDVNKFCRKDLYGSNCE